MYSYVLFSLYCRAVLAIVFDVPRRFSFWFLYQQLPLDLGIVLDVGLVWFLDAFEHSL